jgi:hypothetical protein
LLPDLATGALAVLTTFNGALAGGATGLTCFFALGFAALASFADFDAGMTTSDARRAETGCAKTTRRGREDRPPAGQAAGFMGKMGGRTFGVQSLR